MFSKLIRRGLAALGLFAAATTPAPATARNHGGPALWQVRDKDTTVYLFGTIHLLPQNSSWRTPKFDQAVQNSQSLVVETLIDTADPRELQSLINVMGSSAGLPPIVSRVDPSKRALLETAIARSGIPRQSFDGMETWAAALKLLSVQFQTIGVEGEQGVESVLRKAFSDARKPVGQLETNQEQLAFFDRLPEAAQRMLLEGSIENPAETRGKFGKMLKSWMSGDVDAIGATFNQDLQTSPEMKAALLTRRNYNWSQWIERRMAQPGTVMVAVGAGHLAGNESVQRYLQSRGYKVKRLQ